VSLRYKRSFMEERNSQMETNHPPSASGAYVNGKLKNNVVEPMSS